jgi:hypothetical protein
MRGDPQDDDKEALVDAFQVSVELLLHDVERAAQARCEERDRSDPERAWFYERVLPPTELLPAWHRRALSSGIDLGRQRKRVTRGWSMRWRSPIGSSATMPV